MQKKIEQSELSMTIISKIKKNGIKYFQNIQLNLQLLHIIKFRLENVKETEFNS